MHQHSNYARLGIFILLFFCLSACSFIKPSQTTAQISVTTGTKLNLDSRSRSTPVAIRVYVLKSTTAFNASDFFSLFEKEQQVLSDSLVSREEILLQPGENKTLQPQTIEPGMFIGVAAAFRNIDKAAWRSSIATASGKTNRIKINLDHDTVTMLLTSD